MLNWLLGRQSGFTVGPTVQACTEGLWVWGEPSQHVLPDGSTLNVILLDSEVIGGTEAFNHYDAGIFQHRDSIVLDAGVQLSRVCRRSRHIQSIFRRESDETH